MSGVQTCKLIHTVNFLHHPPFRLTAIERQLLHYLIGHRGDEVQPTAQQIGVALKIGGDAHRVITNLGLRLPLTQRNWRLSKTTDCPAHYTVITVTELREIQRQNQK